MHSPSANQHPIKKTFHELSPKNIATPKISTTPKIKTSDVKKTKLLDSKESFKFNSSWSRSKNNAKLKSSKNRMRIT